MTPQTVSSTVDKKVREGRPEGSTETDFAIWSEGLMPWLVDLEANNEDPVADANLTGLPSVINLTPGESHRAGHLIYYRHDPTARTLYLRLQGHGNQRQWVNVAGSLLPTAITEGTLADTRMMLVNPLLLGSESLAPPDVQLPAEAATDLDTPPARLRVKLLSQLRDSFAAAIDEVFEDGYESSFSVALSAFVQAYGEPAINALEHVMEIERANIEVAAEALHQLGSIVDPGSYQSRLAILSRNLRSPDARLRDAASIGIAAMDDPGAIQAVREAINRESSQSLRRNLQLVLGQLEETQRCRTT